VVQLEQELEDPSIVQLALLRWSELEAQPQEQQDQADLLIMVLLLLRWS
jgi:hypothetical protein